MDFYAVLDQVVKLLRSRGRVSYRALKRQFDLDDELLADLKDELLSAQYPVVEDGDRGLLWTDETATPANPPLPSPRKRPCQTPMMNGSQLRHAHQRPSAASSRGCSAPHMLRSNYPTLWRCWLRP